MGFLTKKEYPLLPLRDMVTFPGANTVLVILKKSSVLVAENAYLNNEHIFCVAQRDKEKENPKKEEDFFEVGTVCEITQKTNMPNGELRLFIRGLEKRRLDSLFLKEGNINCVTKTIHETKLKDDPVELERIKKVVLNKANDLIRYHTKNNVDLGSIFKSLNSDADLICIVTNLMNIDVQAKQSILEEKSILRQYVKLNQYLEIEKSLMDTDRKINDKIDKKIQDYQKKAFLREKLRFIRDELKNEGGEVDDDVKTDVGLLKSKMKKLKVDKYVREKFDSEINKLETIPTFSPEYSTIKNYLDWLVDLPWNKQDRLKNDIKKAEEVLNRDHYGMEDIKERILEFIAVFQRTKQLSGSIICLVGAPGVGKTSLAKSIAEATNRKYAKISLGGLRDEAEIRGHRKTYVGAMPGKIIQTLKKVGTNNPLILLDEIDKMSMDFHGDPASAMLEVLDPEQNHSFNDNFLEVDYDLSSVMFIATANSTQNIPIPLQDRMEIIRLSGYTEDEKLEIAKKYLLKKQMEEHGLRDGEFHIDDAALLKVIRNYTFEAGVRNLERNIEKLVRKATRKLVENPKLKRISIDRGNLKDYLGVENNSYNEANKEDRVGVSTGLAYTDFGGDLLYLEALKFDGSGKLLITGKLGDVMKESAEAAFSYVRSQASKLGITSKIFNKYDFHIHVPEGATPKDGPSAGVAMASALMSSLSGFKIRSDTAMTGEITLTGNVLPIGGLREKLLASLRGNIKNVLIPKENMKDLEKVPDNVKKGIRIEPIERVEEAFAYLMDGWDRNVKGAKTKAKIEKANIEKDKIEKTKIDKNKIEKNKKIKEDKR